MRLNREVGTIGNALRVALRINSGIRFFIRDSEKPAGFSESPFHRRGRKGKHGEKPLPSAHCVRSDKRGNLPNAVRLRGYFVRKKPRRAGALRGRKD